jgi:hypothetical protein
MNLIMLALAMITTGVLQIPLSFAAVQNGCTANPHDINSGPTGDPHDFGEHGNPHDASGFPHQEPADNCPGAQ